VKSGIIGLSLDRAIGAEAKGWEALAIVELEDGCDRRHVVRSSGWRLVVMGGVVV